MSNPTLSRPIICEHCKQPAQSVLHMRIERSGAEAFCRICSECRRHAPEGERDIWISRDKVYRHLTQEQIDSLPVIRPDYSNRCAVCGARGVENHHWAPQAIFMDGEADRWPQDYLCKKHHDEWHQRVTPQLVQGHR